MRLLVGSVLTAAMLTGGGVPAQPDAPVTPAQLHTSAKNLERIALAVHNYNDAHGELPTNLLDKKKRPLLSWRVQILAFIEREPRPLVAPGTPRDIEFDDLFRAFKLDQPWDSEHNKKLIGKMPALYAPVRVKAESGVTFYQGFCGSHGWLNPGARLVASFPDGTSNTLLLAEAAKGVPWTKPEDLEFNGKTVPAVGGVFGGKFHAAMADGSVRLFRKGVDPRTLKMLIDPADGNLLPDDIGLENP
ncbi:MAG TPA: DUF1559 domain-containing protein [Urbifossiella sp.]|nr:DUF1559 domain-containing protein [Urbifossiella sp.]